MRIACCVTLIACLGFRGWQVSHRYSYHRQPYHSCADGSYCEPDDIVTDDSHTDNPSALGRALAGAQHACTLSFSHHLHAHLLGPDVVAHDSISHPLADGVSHHIYAHHVSQHSEPDSTWGNLGAFAGAHGVTHRLRADRQQHHHLHALGLSKPCW